jgi:hypothetical protein
LFEAVVVPWLVEQSLLLLGKNWKIPLFGPFQIRIFEVKI